MTGTRGGHRPCRGTVARSLWEAADPSTPRTARGLASQSGRYAAYQKVFTPVLEHLVREGYLTMEVVRSGGPGRPSKIYKRGSEVFYNQMKDSRYKYVPWSELPEQYQEQAKDRYLNMNPWLSRTDFLFPVTRGKHRPVRLASGAIPVLNISREEAEEKRRLWVIAAEVHGQEVDVWGTSA